MESEQLESNSLHAGAGTVSVVAATATIHVTDVTHTVIITV